MECVMLRLREMLLCSDGPFPKNAASRSKLTEWRDEAFGEAYRDVLKLFATCFLQEAIQIATAMEHQLGTTQRGAVCCQEPAQPGAAQQTLSSSHLHLFI